MSFKFPMKNLTLGLEKSNVVQCWVLDVHGRSQGRIVL